MDTAQPRLEICADKMSDRQELLGHFGIPTFGDGVVIVASLPQTGITVPIVGDDQRPRSDGAINKFTKRSGASVSGDRQPNAPRIAPIFSLVLRGAMRKNSPVTPQCRQTKPSPQRAISRYSPMASGLRFAYEKTLALVGVCVNRIGMHHSNPTFSTRAACEQFSSILCRKRESIQRAMT